MNTHISAKHLTSACLNDALATAAVHGVRGGLDKDQLQDLLRRRSA